MAHPYSTRARLRRLPGADRVSDLADRDRDGVEDTDGSVTTIADALDRAADDIDSELAGRYVVPFAAITDSTPTPTIVSVWTDRLALAELILTQNAADPQALAWKESFLEWAGRVRDRSAHVPGATEVEASEGSVAWLADYAQPVYAGRQTTADADAEAAAATDEIDRQAGW